MIIYTIIAALPYPHPHHYIADNVDVYSIECQDPNDSATCYGV